MHEELLKDTKKWLGLYAKYYDILRRLADLPLDGTPTMEELGLSKTEISSLYRDMYREGFKGTIVDFLGLISTHYLVLEWVKEVVDKENREWGKNWRKVLLRNENDTKNLMRLFGKSPIPAVGWLPDDDMKGIFYVIISELRFMWFLKGKIKDVELFQLVGSKLNPSS